MRPSENKHRANNRSSTLTDIELHIIRRRWFSETVTGRATSSGAMPINLLETRQLHPAHHRQATLRTLAWSLQ